MDIVKRILVAGLFLGGVLCANATVRYMTVEHKSGKKCSFLLDDNPVVTYSDGNLVVNGSATTSYAISDVKDFHFTVGDESGVKNIESDLLRIINVDDKTIRIENAPVNIEVMMMNINAALKSSDVFMSYLAIVGKIAIDMSNTAKLKKITRNL